MNLERLDELETIDPRPLPPWRTESFSEIKIWSDRETARERAKTVRSLSAIVVYSDASGREGHIGAATIALDNNLEVIESHQVQVGLDIAKTHKAQRPTQPNPQMGWVLGPMLGPLLGAHWGPTSLRTVQTLTKFSKKPKYTVLLCIFLY